MTERTVMILHWVAVILAGLILCGLLIWMFREDGEDDQDG